MVLHQKYLKMIPTLFLQGLVAWLNPVCQVDWISVSIISPLHIGFLRFSRYCQLFLYLKIYLFCKACTMLIRNNEFSIFGNIV